MAADNALPAPAPAERKEEDIFRRLWNRSFTSVRVRQSSLSPALHCSRPAPQLDLRRPSLQQARTAKREPRRRRLFQGWEREQADEPPVPSLRVGPVDFSSAALHVMQMWELGPCVPVAPGKRGRRAVDLGFGATYDAAAAEVQPSARLRVRLPLPFAPDAVLRAAPTAELLLKVNVPLSSTGLRLGARLSLPWTEEQFDAVMTGVRIPWRPVFSCHLFSSSEGGLLHFSPRGVELSERSLTLGRDTALRAAASLDFPRAWPPREGDNLSVRVDKLALKTRLRYANY